MREASFNYLSSSAVNSIVRKSFSPNKIVYGEELPLLPFMDMRQQIDMESKRLDETLKKEKKIAQRSLIIRILCLLAGSILFSISLFMG